MENTGNGSAKLWMGFGILTLICGIILAFQNPLIGIPGSIVGIWLIVANMNKFKSNSGQ